MASYHHGNLRELIMERARDIIRQRGVDALSLRAVAVELGVSHNAPSHHFPSRRALLTAIATDGYTRLADETETVLTSGGTFLDAGLAYVRFGLANPVEFEVMFTPSLHDMEDVKLADASSRLLGMLNNSAESFGPTGASAVAGWSLVHGFTQLALSGSLHKAGFADDTTDLVALAGQAAALLSGRGD